MSEKTQKRKEEYLMAKIDTSKIEGYDRNFCWLAKTVAVSPSARAAAVAAASSSE